MWLDYRAGRTLNMRARGVDNRSPCGTLPSRAAATAASVPASTVIALVSSYFQSGSDKGNTQISHRVVSLNLAGIRFYGDEMFSRRNIKPVR